MRLAHAAHAGERALHGVELAGEVERFGGRPRTPHHVEVLVRAAVPRDLVEEVAVARLLVVASPGDHVQRQPSARELIERGELAGRHGRGGEAGAMGQQHAEPLGRLSTQAPR
jgi:hypothetical protein